MNNQLPYYVTYAFHDQKKRRLAIFAKPIFEMGEIKEKALTKPTHLHLYVITCSKKDRFDKKYAHKLLAEFLEFRKMGYDGAIAHPTELLLPIEDNKPKFTFLNWCEGNFWKYKKLNFGMEVPTLVKGDEMLDIDLRTHTELFQLVDMEEDGIPYSKSSN